VWTFSRLDPADSLTEILFGLITVLTFTLGAAAIAERSTTDPRVLVLAAIGCNVAWGLIDAVFYLMATIFVRSRHVRLVRRFRDNPDPARAMAVIAGELDPLLAPVAGDEDRRNLYEAIRARLARSELAPARLNLADVREAAEVCVLVCATAIPAAAPFFIVSDLWLALRLSNLILIGLLFATGWVWARFTGITPWLAGTGFTVMGLALVMIAIALGG
jgi:hypothetical protein